MLIGDKSFFAIEYALDSEFGDEWLYGKFCYWINNIQVGDYGLGTSLRDVLFQMEYIVHDCGKRQGDDICKKTPMKIFYEINNAIYGENEHLEEFVNMPARFEITIPVDVFDYWKVYLVECNDSELILVKNENDPKLNQYKFSIGTVDNILLDAYKSIEKMYLSLANNDVQ